jgi:hypothetical protein
MGSGRTNHKCFRRGRLPSTPGIIVHLSTTRWINFHLSSTGWNHHPHHLRPAGIVVHLSSIARINVHLFDRFESSTHELRTIEIFACQSSPASAAA